MPVRTTLRQDGASRATPQGPGSSVALAGSGRPPRKGPQFASFMARLGGASGKLPQLSVDAEAEQVARLRGETQKWPELARSLEADDEASALDGKIEQADDEILDPLCRALASGLEWKGQGASFVQTAEPKADPATAAARVSLEQVLDQMVRKIAWSGNARTGAMRIELGAGALAGATLLVEADGPEVRVKLELPPGADATSWRERLERRLSSRGLNVKELDVQ